jgi:hypothetical protein
MMTASADIAALVLPDTWPVVTAHRRLPCTDGQALHCMHVSEIHDVVSEAVAHPLAAGVLLVSPAPAPYTVKLDPPVATPFARPAALSSVVLTE